MEGSSEITTLEETVKYLKIGKSTLHKMAREVKIPAVKIESEKNDKVIIRVLYNQKLIEKVKRILGRKWNLEEKYWEVPYREGLISELQYFMGESIIIEPHFHILPLKRVLLIRKYSKRKIMSYMRDNRNFLPFTGKKPMVEKFAYTTKIGDIMKFVYSFKLEQNANFVYNKLSEMPVVALNNRIMEV